jgi:hypothetical protein
VELKNNTWQKRIFYLYLISFVFVENFVCSWRRWTLFTLIHQNSSWWSGLWHCSLVGWYKRLQVIFHLHLRSPFKSARLRRIIPKDCSMQLNSSVNVKYCIIITLILSSIFGIQIDAPIGSTMRFHMFLFICHNFLVETTTEQITTPILFHYILMYSYYIMLYYIDRLCGLVVRVPGYRYRGPG